MIGSTLLLHFKAVSLMSLRLDPKKLPPKVIFCSLGIYYYM